MQPSTQHGRRGGSFSQFSAAQQLPTRYVWILDQVLRLFVRDPFIIGIYLIIARCALVTSSAVPLSAADLVRWSGYEPKSVDGERLRIAIMRAIRRLEAQGFLMITRTNAVKHRFLPTWGRDDRGTIRPWRWDIPDLGKPAHLRCRRVSLSIFDHYIGRLDPQPKRTPALVTRYFAHPLLDLRDLGTYAIAALMPITPTPRLLIAGLVDDNHPVPTRPLRDLLTLAAAGQLSTLVDSHEIVVMPSAAGWWEIGTAPPSNRSGSRSKRQQQPITELVAEKSLISSLQSRKTETSFADPQIAWDDISELTNHDSSPADTDRQRWGNSPINYTETSFRDYYGTNGACVHDRLLHDLDQRIRIGHCALNPGRVILEGEWIELLQIQNEYGIKNMLVWQARAVRVQRTRAIVPGYYKQCAAREAVDTYRPRRKDQQQAPTAEAASNKSSLIAAEPPPLILDSSCDVLLAKMGIEEREKLAAVPYDLIVQWNAIIDHPGLAARFADPCALAYTKMRKGLRPFSQQQLDRWASQEATRRASEPLPALTEEELTRIATRDSVLRERFNALAPLDIDQNERIAMMIDLEDGLPDEQVLARFDARRADQGAKQPDALPSPHECCASLLGDLRASIGPELSTIVDTLSLQLSDGVLRGICEHPNAIGAVQTEIVPRLRALLRAYGWSEHLLPTIQISARGSLQPVQEAVTTGRPDWIMPSRWKALPAKLRVALHGTEFVNGTVQVPRPAQIEILQSYLHELESLVSESVSRGKE